MVGSRVNAWLRLTRIHPEPGDEPASRVMSGRSGRVWRAGKCVVWGRERCGHSQHAVAHRAVFLEWSLKPLPFQLPWKTKRRTMNAGPLYKSPCLIADHWTDHLEQLSSLPLLSLRLGSSLTKEAHFLQGDRLSWALHLLLPFSGTCFLLVIPSLG